MADAPKLNSATDATSAKYAPLSWLALLALLVAVLFVLLLLVLGWNAYSAGQPLMEVGLFVLPAAGLLLAFIARRQIRTAEGARTGEGYANAAWWICVVVGACYAAFLLATDLAVRADAEKELLRWTDKLHQAGGESADQPVREAYAKTLDPAAGAAVFNNPAAVHGPQNALAFAHFRHSPLVLIWGRNRDTAKLVPNGLQKWEVTPDGKLQCVAAATLKCPEGEFPVYVPMQGTTDPNTKVRSWQVQPGQKYLDPELASFTRYGWLMAALEWRSVEAASQFCSVLNGAPPFAQSAAVDNFIARSRPVAHTEAVVKGLEARLLLAGPSALVFGPTEPTRPDPKGDPKTDPRPAYFFARTNGQPMTDDEYTRPDGGKMRDGLKTLQKLWELPSASGLRLSPDARLRPAEVAPRYPIVDTSDPARVLFKVVVDFVPPRDDYRGLFTTGYLVLACDDPAVLKELSEAKAAGGPLTRERPEWAATRTFNYRVLRLETDLVPITPPPKQTAGDPMGGP